MIMMIMIMMMILMTVVFLGVVLGVDSRLGYWDLVGGGEIRNMVIVVFIIITIIYFRSYL